MALYFFNLFKENRTFFGYYLFLKHMSQKYYLCKRIIIGTEFRTDSHAAVQGCLYLASDTVLSDLGEVLVQTIAILFVAVVLCSTS